MKRRFYQFYKIVFQKISFFLITQQQNFLMLEGLKLYKIHEYYFINKLLTLYDVQNLDLFP